MKNIHCQPQNAILWGEKWENLRVAGQLPATVYGKSSERIPDGRL